MKTNFLLFMLWRLLVKLWVAGPAGGATCGDGEPDGVLPGVRRRAGEVARVLRPRLRDVQPGRPAWKHAQLGCLLRVMR